MFTLSNDRAAVAHTIVPAAAPRSWLVEFVTAPFRDIDGRAEWTASRRAAAKEEAKQARAGLAASARG